MKTKTVKALIAGVLSAATMCTAASAAYAASLPATLDVSGTKTAEGSTLFDFSFNSEDDLKYFSNRGGDDTTELSLDSTEGKGAKGSMLASGRTESWNGPAFRLDGVLEPNTEYLISASVKGKYYTGATFSFQYTVDVETHPLLKSKMAFGRKILKISAIQYFMDKILFKQIFLRIFL